MAAARVRGYLSTTFAALRVRDYRLFAIAQLVSVCGTWMQKLAQGWLVLVLTDSGLILGVTVALQQVPTMLFTTFGGLLADRYDKRLVLLCCAVGGFVPALFLGIVIQLDAAQVWMVMVAALVQGLADAVEKPARLTIVNDIAGPEVLTNAIALNSIIQNSGKVVGPGIAGALIGTVGMSAAFLLNAASFLPVIVVLLMIRARTAGRPRARIATRGSTRATVRYVGQHPALGAALGLMFVTGLLANNWQVLVPTLIRDTFGGDAATVGLAFALMGVGGVVGGLALAGALRATAAGLMVNSWVFAAAFVLLAVCPWILGAYALLFVLGAAGVTMKATASSVLQVQADPEMRGRVISLLVLCLAGTSPIGGPLIGWLSESADPRLACAVAAVGTALATGWAMRYLRTRNSAAVRQPPGAVVLTDVG